MSAVDPVGPAPEAHRYRFLSLLLAACAAPIFWIGQLVLSYAITAFTCYPADVPHMSGPRSLSVWLFAFDAIALAAALAGGAVALSAWLRTARAKKGAAQPTRDMILNRTRFLALWGMISSLWFFFAILFNAIASTTPFCGE